MNKEWIVEGNVWRVGDNVNTESITPSKWRQAGGDLLMAHIGELLIPDFPQKVKKGDIWVGGSNLGCSSSRPAAGDLKKKGISVIICHSAARIFYRTALNSGVPIFEIGEDVGKISMGDRLRIDVRKGDITNLTTGEKIQAKGLPDFIMRIIDAGGIKPYVLSRRSEYSLLK